MGGKATHITTVVRLKNKGIKNLPDITNLQILPLFTRLQIIQLQNNKISEIPLSVCALLAKSHRIHEFLQEVNLSHNRLSSLPPEFFLLINLRKVYLDHNNLTEFYQQFLSFYRLEELSLKHNKIKHLPWCLNRLKRLQVLHLENNEIDYVPNTLGRLQNLIELQILPNPLSTINDEDVLIACHSGNVNFVLDYLIIQNVPPEYPFLSDIQKTIQRKSENNSKLPEDQKILRKLLKNKEGFNSLETHMLKEHSSENILFWKTLSTFSNNYSSDQPITTEELISEAKKIYDDFIAPESKYTLNLPAQVMQDLNKIFTDKFVYPEGINQWVFKAAYKAVLELISRDTFRRYKNSPEGAEILKMILDKDTRQSMCLQSTMKM